MMKALFKFQFISVVLLLSSGCATSPTGIPQLHIVPESMVSELGVTSFQKMKDEKTVTKDVETTRLVECIASRIVKHVDLDTQWEVKVFEDEAVNAFALPGGKIGVYTGLIEASDNADQLAAVIGHEVGHVIARHGSARISASIVSELGLAVSAAALSKEGSNSSKYMPLLGMGAALGVILPYGRAQETEADILGINLMAKSGFDPRESVKFWENMQSKKKSSTPQFLSTHPSSQSRIDTLTESMDEAVALYENADSNSSPCGSL